MTWYHSLEVWWFVIVPAFAVGVYIGCRAYTRWSEYCSTEGHRRRLAAEAVMRQRRTVVVKWYPQADAKAQYQAAHDRVALALYDQEMDDYLSEQGLA